MHEHSYVVLSLLGSFTGALLVSLLFFYWLRKQLKRHAERKLEIEVEERRAAWSRFEQEMEAKGFPISLDNPFRLDRG